MQEQYGSCDPSPTLTNQRPFPHKSVLDKIVVQGPQTVEVDVVQRGLPALAFSVLEIFIRDATRGKSTCERRQMSSTFVVN
jgi:hypothetical protein